MTNVERALDVTARLGRITADLEGYIERRAFELAAPMVEMAGALIDEHLALMQGQFNRYEELIKEFRRQLEATERHRAAARKEAKEGRIGLHSSFYSIYMSGMWRQVTEKMSGIERGAAADALIEYAKRCVEIPSLDEDEVRWWLPPVKASR